MPWKKANKDLADILVKLLADRACERRMMFGAPTFFLRGNMFAGVHEDTVILRLSEPDRKAISEQFDEVMPFTPMGAHVMKEYVALPESVVHGKKQFEQWLDRAFRYAGSLPPKQAKRAGKKKP